MKAKATKYRNLKAEMARNNITVIELAEAMGCTRQTLYAKLRGAVDWNLSDMHLIKCYLMDKGGRYVGLDYLFDEN